MKKYKGKVALIIAATLLRVFKPKEVVSPADWVEKHIRLDTKTSPTLAGRYSLRHTPYLRQIYEDVGNPRVRKIIVKKAAQTGLTQFANNVILYYVCNHTFPCLMVMPSKEAAQQFCERSLTPTVYNSNALKPFISNNADDLKKTEYLFKSCIVRVIGAGSPSKLASNPAVLAIIDEADKMEDFAEQNEAPALELVEDRTITFPNDKKIIVLSTPTTTNTSVVHSQYLLGSQSKYYCKCPKCNKEQELQFANLKWENCKLDDGEYDLDKVEANTYYECEGCQAHLTEVDKIEMVRGGRWVDTNPKPFPYEIRSYHVSALYSFNVSWGNLAKLFLLSKADIGKLRNFYNSYLGECFEQQVETLQPTLIDEIVKASPHYVKGELLQKPQILLAAFDTQGLSFWYAVEAVFMDGTSAVIDWGNCSTFSDVKLISQKQYAVKGTGEYVSIARSLIDEGYKTDEVRDFCVSMAGRFTGVRGVPRRTTAQNPISETTFPHRGRNLATLLVNDDYFKNLLYISGLKHKTFTLHFPQDTDETLKKQITAEKQIEKKNPTGRLETFWKCPSRNNHLGDCLKYIEGFKHLLYPHLEHAREVERQKALQPEAAQPQPQVRQYTIPHNTYDSQGWG